MNQNKKKITIHQAAKAGNILEVKRFLSEGVSINAQNDIKNTPLHIAALHGHFNIVVFLCENGADFSAINELDYTPLHYAACWGHEKIVRFLLLLNAGKESRTMRNRTPLHLAAFGGSREAIEILLAEGANIEARDNENETPLCIAVAQNQIEIIRILLQKNANTEALNDENQTPLQIATSRGLVEAARLLLQHKANIHIKDKKRNTLLHYATLLPKNIEMLSLLLEGGVEIDASNELEQTPLQAAIFLNHTENIKFLLERGANVNAKGINGITALHIASYMGYPEIVILLLQKKANIDTEDYKGNTALHLATLMGHKQVVNILIQRGANTKITNKIGNTASYIAKLYGHDNVAKRLQQEISRSASYDFSYSQFRNAIACISHLVEKECNQEMVSFEIKDESIFLKAKKSEHHKFCTDLFGVLFNFKHNAVKQQPLRIPLSSVEKLLHTNLMQQYKKARNVTMGHHELFSFFPKIFNDYTLNSAAQNDYVVYSYEISQSRLDDVAKKMNQALRSFGVFVIHKKEFFRLKFPREIFLSKKFAELKKAIASIDWNATTSVDIKPVKTISFREYESHDDKEREEELKRRREERAKKDERKKGAQLESIFSECRLKTQYEDDSFNDWSEIEEALPEPELKKPNSPPMIDAPQRNHKDDNLTISEPDLLVAGVRLIREEFDDKGKEEAPREKKKEKKKPKRQKMSLLELEMFIDSSSSSSSSASVNEIPKTYTKGFQYYRERNFEGKISPDNAKETTTINLRK